MDRIVGVGVVVVVVVVSVVWVARSRWLAHVSGLGYHLRQEGPK